MANIAQRIIERILVNEGTKLTYAAAEQLVNLPINPQYPKLWRAIFGGLLHIILLYPVGMLFVGGISKNLDWGMGFAFVFAGMMIFDCLRRRTTYGYKQDPIRVPDRRFKVGYRIEYRLVKDHENLVPLEPRHLRILRLEAFLYFMGLIGTYILYVKMKTAI